MKPVRILFTIPNFTTAGSGREMFNIVERLDKSLFKPLISVESDGGNLLEEIIGKSYEIIYGRHGIPGKLPVWKKIIKAIKLGKIYRKHNIAIWISFHWSSNYFEPLIARIAGAKYVYVKKNMNWNKAWWLKSYLSNWIIARNTTLLTKYFHTSVFREKTSFITGGVNLERFKRHKTEENYRTRFALEENTKIVSCVAQILPIKNQLLLVKAAHQLKNIVVFLAGAERDPKYASEIKEYITKNKLESVVYLLGNVSDPVELLNETDVFVLPTNRLYGHEEGCPVSLLEAMACGTTCVASNVAGSVDLIRDGQNGYIFESDSLESLISKIKEAINMPLVNTREAMKPYDLGVEAKRFQQLFLKMIKRDQAEKKVKTG
jgi:glycosyltransferase involved in cell wall biosynthesis